MEQDSHLDNSRVSRDILEGQLRECYGRVVYTHKTYEKCADILLSDQSRIKFWQIILSGICTGAGFIFFMINIFGANGVAVVTISSTILLVLNLYTKDYDLGETSQKYKQAASDIWYIREKYLSLLTDLRIGEKSLPDIQKDRDELLIDLHKVYSCAPSTNSRAYRKAQQAIQKLDEMTFSDEEIDKFLPHELRRG